MSWFKVLSGSVQFGGTLTPLSISRVETKSHYFSHLHLLGLQALLGTAHLPKWFCTTPFLTWSLISAETKSVGGNKALSDERNFAAACRGSIKCTGFQFADGLLADFDLRNLSDMTHSVLQSTSLPMCHHSRDQAECVCQTCPLGNQKNYWELCLWPSNLPSVQQDCVIGRTMNMNYMLGEASVWGWGRAQVTGCEELIFAAK